MGFEEHLEQNKGHVSRLEQIFESLGENPKGKKCKGMEGLVEEGAESTDEDLDDNVKDAGLIGAAQRAEHYEIAAYGTVKAFAETLGQSEHVSLLEETLEEEKKTDEKLTELAKQINVQAGKAAHGESAGAEKKGKRPDFCLDFAWTRAGACGRPCPWVPRVAATLEFVTRSWAVGEYSVRSSPGAF